MCRCVQAAAARVCCFVWAAAAVYVLCMLESAAVLCGLLLLESAAVYWLLCCVCAAVAAADAVLQRLHCKPIDCASGAVTKKRHLVLYPPAHPFLPPFQIDSATSAPQKCYVFPFLPLLN